VAVETKQKVKKRITKKFCNHKSGGKKLSGRPNLVFFARAASINSGTQINLFEKKTMGAARVGKLGGKVGVATNQWLRLLLHKLVVDVIRQRKLSSTVAALNFSCPTT